MAGLITTEEQKHWEEIFQKNNKHGGLDRDDKVFAQLLEFNDNLEGIINTIRGKGE